MAIESYLSTQVLMYPWTKAALLTEYNLSGSRAAYFTDRVQTTSLDLYQEEHVVKGKATAATTKRRKQSWKKWLMIKLHIIINLLFCIDLLLECVFTVLDFCFNCFQTQEEIKSL